MADQTGAVDLEALKRLATEAESTDMGTVPLTEMQLKSVVRELERIPELEREREEYADLIVKLRTKLARAERVETAARELDASLAFGIATHAREENQALREDLLKRGRHLPGCAWLACIEAGQHGHDAMARMVRNGCPPCDCGWETMRAALAREDGDDR